MPEKLALSADQFAGSGSIPRGEPFDWVDKVSIELTTQMLSTLLGFPWRDRRKLAHWSDVVNAVPGSGFIETEDDRDRELLDCLSYFQTLWAHQRAASPNGSLLSMMAHSDATRDVEPMDLFGAVVLLIVGGSDTMRNCLTGGLLAMSEFPDEYAKLRADPSTTLAD